MLDDIRRHITTLISMYETEKQRADMLDGELSSCRAELDGCRKQIAELNRKIDNLKLTGAFAGTGDNAESKERISRLIREIDKCIKLLGN